MEETTISEKRLLVKVYNTLLDIQLLNLETAYRGTPLKWGDTVVMRSGHYLVLDKRIEIDSTLAILAHILQSLSKIKQPKYFVGRMVDHKFIYGVG